MNATASRSEAIDLATTEAFLLLSASMAPIFVSPTAAQILIYPQKIEAQKDLDHHLATKIRSVLLERSARTPVLVAHFQSGKRLYQCRSFRVNALTRAESEPSLAVLLERRSRGSVSLEQVSVRFNLTTREQEVLQHLLQAGPTTKQIATRMGISPNTVKTFLRLMMVKMGVSTRSGILGKAFDPKSSLGSNADGSGYSRLPQAK